MGNHRHPNMFCGKLAPQLVIIQKKQILNTFLSDYQLRWWRLPNTNWGVCMPQNMFGWRWLPIEDFCTPPFVSSFSCKPVLKLFLRKKCRVKQRRYKSHHFISMFIEKPCKKCKGLNLIYDRHISVLFYLLMTFFKCQKSIWIENMLKNARFV